MSGCNPRGPFDLLPRGLRVSEGDVFRDGHAEQEALLEDDANVPAQVVQIELSHVCPVHQHLPGLGVVESRDQAQERRLARPGRTENRDNLPRFGPEGDVLQYRIVGLVAEANTLEFDFAPGPL